MAFHVPFSQRPSGRHQAQPIYIGFEPPRRRRAKFNWWGFGGIFVFFLSLGLLSPIALLMSLLGLRRKPRKMAVVGTGLSLVGTGIIAAIIISSIHHAEQMKHNRVMARQRIQVARQVEDGNALLVYAASEFEEFRDSHEGRLPSDLDGNALALKHVDPWDQEIMYEVDTENAALRSAGPDKEFFTRDDLTYTIDGETDREPLLPIEKDEVAD